MAAVQQEPSRLPLCIDLDGTLIRTDLLHESVLLLAKRSWLSILRLPFWLLEGKAFLKQRVAERVQLDAATLPYNEAVVELTRQARAEGRTTVLATASPRSQAEELARHLGIFDQVVATEGSLNLSGPRKAARLEQLFGRGGFVYAGNGPCDLPVWAASGGAIVVGCSRALHHAAAGAATVLETVVLPRPSAKTLARALRVHQWSKNLLVFIPLLAAHRTSEMPALMAALLAFVAFSLVASAVYVINDLLDLPADRVHARKRHRPFACGAMSIAQGAALVPLLLGAAALACAWLPLAFSATLLGYFAITCLYSFWLKNHVVVDVMLLASLYTSRIIAGAAATGIVPSFWLLAFSMSMFLSLAIVKRYSEMLVAREQHKEKAAGRGYLVSDMPLLLAQGVAAGYIAILVLALYVNGADVAQLYPNRWALWMVLPPVLYWITRVWMKSHRGEMHDDPVVFAATDKQSWAMAALVAIALWLATVPA